jgi:mono/diheme cytochrome c family protein
MTLHEIVLIAHSYLRWLALVALCFACLRHTWRWVSGATWDRTDERGQAAMLGTLDLQFLLGLILYVVLSPFPRAFLSDMAAGMESAPLRFFGMEHALGMLLGVGLAHVGRKRAERWREAKQKHRSSAIFAWLALLSVLVSIPWPGRSSARPLFRGLGATAPAASAVSAAPACPDVYRSRCASCHGVSGRGDGPLAASLNPPPRDFTKSTFGRYRTDEALRQVIAGGGSALGLSPVMPAHPDLSDAELGQLVRCVRSFGSRD